MNPACVGHRSTTLHSTSPLPPHANPPLISFSSLPASAFASFANIASVDDRAFPARVLSVATRINSLRLLPVVEQLYCGYCVNAIARRTPSRFISSRQVSVSGSAYRNMTYGLCGADSGLSSSRRAHMAAPCVRVHRKIGEPPPISVYCFSILGVRRLAMTGAR